MKRDPQSPETIFGEAIDIAAPDERAAYLDRACENDPDLRVAVEQLVVDHFRAGRFLETPVAQFAATINMPGEASHGEQPGTQIGPYKLLQQIGEGGMGVVYMAEQTKPVARRVAIKVIKPGMDTREVIARFESERQALAMMDHPNIAKVLDAGTTGDGEKGVGSLLCTAPDGPSRQKTPDPFFSGRPYFVMELVKGLPITRYCDEHHLSLRERLELFVPVLQAVQHAHQKGIIHRDLKPSNVLIAEYDDRAVPKIIDFGVAKAAGGTLTEKTMFTQLGQLVGTLEYMSPEQAKFNQLDVDTRTDIYAMGVLLYELLTGTTPFGRQRLHAAAFDEMLRILREEEPPKPSTRLTTIDNLLTVAANRHIEPARLSKFLRGELDWIVMKALEKDRNRRYETANGFASDVQRYLSDEAVQACPPSAAYRFRKLVQRNKGAFASASTVAVGVLLAVVMLAVSYVRITRETALKEQALKDKHAALTAARASEKDANTKEALAKAAQSEAQENLNDARAAVDQMLTRVADRLSAMPQMEHVRRELLEDALKFYQKFLEKKGDDPVLRRETAWAYQRLARIQCSLGQLVEAEVSFRKAFATFEELEAQSPLEASCRTDLARARLQFAGFLCELGKREEPEEHLRRAVQMAEDLVKEFPKDSAYDELLVVANLNLITLTRRPPDQAEEMLRRNLKLTKDTYLVGYIYWHLGVLGARQGRYPEAKKDYLKALEKCETLASENPSSSSAQRDLGMVRVDLADAIAADGQREEAEPLYRRAIAILDKLANDYPGIHRHRAEQAGVQYKYATLLKTLDRTADAEQAYRRAVDLYAKVAADFVAIPAYQQIAFDQRLELGRFLVEAGRAQDAQQIYGEAIGLAGKLTADFPTRLNHWQGLVRSHIELGRLLERSGKTPAAEEAFRQALAISERLEAEHGGKPDYRREVARSHLDAAWILRFANRHSETEQLYRWALEHFVRLAGESPQSLEPRQDLAFAHFLLADYYRWAPGRLQDSEKLFRQALEEYQKLSADFPDVPGYHITSADCRERLASVLLYQGRLQEAELALEEALALAERLAEQHPADRTVRMTLAMGSRHWGETLWRMARPQEVEKAFRRSEAILEKLAADFPHESWYQLEWGLACQMFVALLARDLKQPQEAEEFYRRAVASFEKLAAEFPHDLSHRTRLAIVHREWASCLEAIGRTQEAKEIFEQTITNLSKAVELGSKDVWGVSYPLALLSLSTGRTKEYRALCETLLERFGQSSDPDFWVVIICKLAPDALADLTRPVQFAEQMLARNPDDAELVGILGDTLYRKGDLDAAVLRLEASIRGAPGIGVHWRSLFLAMAYHRLGRTAEAQQLLTETTQWMEKNAQANLAEGAELSQPLAWQLRLDLQLLRHEAETLIAGEESH